MDEMRSGKNKSQLEARLLIANADSQKKLNYPNPIKITSNLNTLQFAANSQYGRNFENLGDNEKIKLYKSLVHEIEESLPKISKKREFSMRENTENSTGYHHKISADFKNLGYMSQHNRVFDYYPQDDKVEFGSKPILMLKKEIKLPKYHKIYKKSPSPVRMKKLPQVQVSNKDKGGMASTSAKVSPLRKVTEFQDYRSHSKPAVSQMESRKVVDKEIAHSGRFTQMQ